MEQEGGRALTSEARLCYVCSGSVEHLVESWAKVQQASCPLALQVPLLCRALITPGSWVGVGGHIPSGRDVQMREESNLELSVRKTEPSVADAFSKDGLTALFPRDAELGREPS